MSGQWRYDLWNPDGSAVIRSPWGDNVITDLGIVAIASENQAIVGIIGDSTTTPVESNSTIGGFLAADSFYNDSTSGGGSSPNYEYYHTRKWQFAAGVGTGTVNELGCAPSGVVDGTQLFSHHAVIPGIPKAANQILDTYYRLTIWPYMGADIIGTGVIDGETYDTVIRGIRYGPQSLASVFGAWGVSAGGQRNYDGELNSDVTELYPLGTSSGNPVNSWASLGSGAIANGGYTEFRMLNAIGQGNIGSTGIRSSTATCSNGQAMQIRFGADGNGVLALDARIPKDYRKEMTLDYRYEWTRK